MTFNWGPEHVSEMSLHVFPLQWPTSRHQADEQNAFVFSRVGYQGIFRAWRLEGLPRSLGISEPIPPRKGVDY